ncbi:PKD domain-containing protein [Cryobacterium sp. Y11]|uniref:PKD domain-containing protein n=1 Tax=Cryobacterium sp. Y11 TaxID=2045016 RepID=UPI000CE4B588|nr:PKD domain-containing protein [Cryobacterium sp. Y11]
MRAVNVFVASVAGAILVLTACVGSAQSANLGEVAAAATATSVHFTASGDISASAGAVATLTQVADIAPDLHFALGDLSYGATGAEQTWCDFVTAKVGAGFPFELISGNHESNGLNGNVNDFAACLPNQLPGVIGTYGRQYYVDVPQVNPLVRFIMISPALTYPDGVWSYAAGSPRYQWTANTIDDARSKAIGWVVVGMHKPCLSVGQYACDPGAALTNLLVNKRVDLVLNGHEHLYARSKQLALGASCGQLVPGSYSAGCVADGDNALAKGAGTVFAIVGTGGTPLRDVVSTDTEAPYFAASSGLNLNPSFGNLDVSVTPSSLTARFLPVAGTFTDAFTIAVAGPQENQPPVASFTATCPSLTCSVDAAASSDPDGTIASYAWNFGDGGAATGRVAAHDYAIAGNYTVTLTVTDIALATDSTTRAVAPASPPDLTVLATDAFTRTVTNGLGTALSGGPWTTTGSASMYSVTGTGRIRLATPGTTANGLLGQVSTTASDVLFTVSVDKTPTGTGTYVSANGRNVVGVGAYRAKVVLRSTGVVGLSLVRVNSSGGGEVTLQAATNAPGVSFLAGDQLKVRLQVTGTSPTTIRAKVWKLGSEEPVTWQRSITDATAALQIAGGVGFTCYLSSSATNAPVIASIDDLLVVEPQG